MITPPEDNGSAGEPRQLARTYGSGCSTPYRAAVRQLAMYYSQSDLVQVCYLELLPRRRSPNAANARFPVSAVGMLRMAPYRRTCPRRRLTQYHMRRPSNAASVAMKGKILEDQRCGICGRMSVIWNAGFCQHAMFLNRLTIRNAFRDRETRLGRRASTSHKKREPSTPCLTHTTYFWENRP